MLEATEIEINGAVNDAEFKLVFPEGTRVHDKRSMSWSTVVKGALRSEILDKVADDIHATDLAAAPVPRTGDGGHSGGFGSMGIYVLGLGVASTLGIAAIVLALRRNR